MTCLRWAATGRKARMTSGTGNKGFTLIELMIAASILAAGTILIQQGLLRSANVLSHHAYALAAQRWAEEKLWEAREAELYSDVPQNAAGSGTFTASQKVFGWSLEVEARSGEAELRYFNLLVGWTEGNRRVELNRAAYAAQ